jgi:hypothetical protein
MWDKWRVEGRGRRDKASSEESVKINEMYGNKINRESKR